MGFYIGRYKNIEKASYDIEVVTPMFIGGANPKTAELRVPSIKGVLRFWWRATSGIENIRDLKRIENEIFGSTEEKSKVTINIVQSNINTSKSLFNGKIFMCESKGKEFPIDILHYLAFGAIVYDKNIRGNKVDKEYILPGSNFQLEIYATKQYLTELKKALNYFILFGTIGSKSRNGFGSLYSKDIELVEKFEFDNELLDYTSFSKYSKVIKLDEKESWNKALSSVGLIYKDARLSLEKRHSFVKRGLVAKPIEAKGETISDDIRLRRHSKPYFLHVNKLKNGKYQGQILFLPYKYYLSDKREEYLKVCNSMNEKIEDLAGGKKWE